MSKELEIGPGGGLLPKQARGMFLQMPQEPQSAEEACQFMKKREPELWASCLPRFYDNSVQAYGSYKMFALALTSTLAWVRDNPKEVPAVQRNIYLAACEGRESDHQLIFVGASEARLALDTDYAPAMRWDELPRPYSAGVFVIPPGIIHNTGYGDVDFVGYAFLEPNKEYRYEEDFPGFELAQASLLIWTAMRKAPSFTIFEEGMGIETKPTIVEAIGSTPESFLPTCKRLVFGLLLDSARLKFGSASSVKTKSKKELWTPHLLID